MVRNTEIICSYALANYSLPFYRKTTKGTNVVPCEETTNIDKLRKECDGCRYVQKKISRINTRKEIMSEDGKLSRIPQDREIPRNHIYHLSLYPSLL